MHQDMEMHSRRSGFKQSSVSRNMPGGIPRSQIHNISVPEGLELVSADDVRWFSNSTENTFVIGDGKRT